MRQIAQSHSLLAALDQLYSQRFNGIRIESSAGAELGQVIFQLVQGALDAGFELGEIIGIDVFCFGGGRFDVAFVFLLAAFLEEMGGACERSAWWSSV